MKTIWIMNHYAGDMFVAGGGRHFSFAKYLKRKGFHPVVLCANSKHNSDAETFFPMNTLWEEHTEMSSGVPYIFVKTHGYRGNGASRVMNMLEFYRNVKKASRGFAEKAGKPDIIIASSVHPMTLLAGIQVAKRFKIKCVCEIRDLWPESIVVYLSNFKKNNPLIRLLYRGEKYLYKKADALLFTMKGGYQYIQEKGWEGSIPGNKVYHINNGVDLEDFLNNRSQYQIDDNDLADPSIFKVVYAGSIRKVNNVGKLLDIAKLIRNDRIRFLIWGEGDELDSLKERLESENIKNVVFKGYVEKKYIPYIVSCADLNIAHNGESPIFRYGISFNKLFDYFAACKPVISDFHADHNPIIEANAGPEITDSSPQMVANAIEGLADMDESAYKQYCSNSERASEKYNYEHLTDELIDVLKRVIQR